MPEPEAQSEPPRLRGAARDEQIRAGIEPLPAGERPVPLVVAAALCVALGTVNLALWAFGADVRQRPSAALVLMFAAVTFAAAWGLWTARYGAVLAFQAVLAATIIIAGLSVLVAGNGLAVALCATVLVFGSWLFWKLVRVLARLRVPEPGAPDGSA